MTTEIRSARPDEMPRFAAVLSVATGQVPDSDALARFVDACAAARAIVAVSDGVVVGATGSESLELTVPGPRVVPAVRISHTGVLPAFRRRGLVTRMLGRQLEDLAAGGASLAVFTTTGPGIFRDIGYAPATQVMEVEVETVALGRSAAGGAEVRLLQPDELAATLPPVFERHRLVQPGQVQRTDRFWRQWLLDEARHRPYGAGPRFAAVVPADGGAADGYVTYRLVAGHARDQPVERLLVEDLIATSPAAWTSLWSFCCGFRQARVVSADQLAVDDPLPWLLPDVHSARFLRVREFLWVRLLDVGSALSARLFQAGDIVLDLRDNHLPANAGRYRLTSDGGPTNCRRTARTPDLALGAADLAAAYLGGVRVSALHRAGRVAELTTGAVLRMDAMFVSSPMPWTVAAW